MKRRKLPRYGIDGQRINKKFKRRTLGKKGRCLIGVLFFFLMFYLPGIVYHHLPEQNPETGETLERNKNAISIANDIVKEAGSEDFDSDGLSNEEEIDLGCNPWNPDSDGDGICDGAEQKRNTDPTKADDGLLMEIKAADQKKGESFNTPYQINGIILWADDYNSKAYGGVVRTLNGYRFSNFKGWAQFPKKYCYEFLPNGQHIEMKYRKEENVYQIKNDHEIINTDEKLNMVNKITWFGLKRVYLKEGKWLNRLTDLLPDFGIISGERIALSDTQPDSESFTKANIQSIAVEDTETPRFGVKKNSLEDLSSVYAKVRDGGCVCVSLFSQTKGEALGIVYGYDRQGNLLVADRKQRKPAGKILIKVSGGKSIRKGKTVVQRSWIDFDGFGFHSNEGDQINFFAATPDEAKPVQKSPDVSDFHEDELSEGSTEP